MSPNLLRGGEQFKALHRAVSIILVSEKPSGIDLPVFRWYRLPVLNDTLEGALGQLIGTRIHAVVGQPESAFEKEFHVSQPINILTVSVRL